MNGDFNIDNLFDDIKQDMEVIERRLNQLDESSVDSILRALDEYTAQHPSQNQPFHSMEIACLDQSDADLEIQLEDLESKLKHLPENSAQRMDLKTQRQRIASELDRRYMDQYQLEGVSPYPGAVVEQIHFWKKRQQAAEALSESRYTWAEMEAKEQQRWTGADLTEGEW